MPRGRPRLNSSREGACDSMKKPSAAIYKVGEQVFAKVKGYPPWPALITLKHHKEGEPAANAKYNVKFYGTHQIGVCKGCDLTLFVDMKSKMVITRNKNLLVAILEAEMYPKGPPLRLHQNRKRDDVDSAGQSTLIDSKDEVVSCFNDKVKNRESKRGRKRKAPTDAVVKKEPKTLPDIGNTSRQAAATVTKVQTNPKSTKIFVAQVHKSAKNSDMAAVEDLPLFSKVQPALSRFLEKILTNAGLLESLETADDGEPLSSMLGEHNLSNLMESLNQAQVENWEEEDVLCLLSMVINSCASNRISLLAQVAGRMSQGHGPEFMQNLVKVEALDELLQPESLQFNNTKNHLLLQVSSAYDLVLPWTGKQLTFLNGFNNKPPTILQRVQHFNTFQYVCRVHGDKFIKIYSKEVLLMMKELMENTSAPPYYKKVVDLALRMEDKNFTKDSKPLALETQLEALSVELKFRTSIAELTLMLGNVVVSENYVDRMLDHLFKLYNMPITKVMLWKMPESVNVVHQLITLKDNFGSKADEDMNGDLEDVKAVAKNVMKKFEKLVLLPELIGQPKSEWKQNIFYQALKDGNLALVRASESRPQLYSSITQEPIVVRMQRRELEELQSLISHSLITPDEMQKSISCIWASAHGFSL